MSFENLKITAYEDNVKDLPDYPSDGGYNAQRLKEIFDGRTDKEIKEKFNALIDAIEEKFREVDESGEENKTETKAYADSAVSAHNIAEGTHADIRESVDRLKKRLDVIADSDDVTLDQLSEIVNYIKDNREIIEVITTSKANASDVEALEGRVEDLDERTSLLSAGEETEGSVAYQIAQAILAIDLSDYAIKEEVDEAFVTVDADISKLQADVGNIDTALDSIIAMQTSYIGGDSE